ncbi:site-specific DNA-methyltransferase [Patescibacteria group bacterium]|nr:MAG: site-specific DNA-methyltransferase [Patescibacteria group bacterium]
MLQECEPIPVRAPGGSQNDEHALQRSCIVTSPDTTTPTGEACTSPVAAAYATDLGAMYHATIEDFLDEREADLAGEVQLVFFSPPFPLNRKKRYAHKDGQAYLQWLGDLAPRLAALLKPNGSLVVEIGNAWEPGRPVMSLLPLQALMAIAERGEMNICQQFVCHNPARLPSPAQWVTIERIRVKDSYTHVWWMSPDEKPLANNRHVLRPYSPAMKDLLERQSYNDGKRPSGFDIRPESFLQNNGGAIPPNALEVQEQSEDEYTENFFKFANTSSTDGYSTYCRDRDLKLHPARMPSGLPEFFIEFLTVKDDLVLDPFGGSNTTGAIAEKLGRRWIAVEPEGAFIEGSQGRFPELTHLNDECRYPGQP